jgi:hypothetical protein
MGGLANLGCFLVSHGDDVSRVDLQEFTTMEPAQKYAAVTATACG